MKKIYLAVCCFVLGCSSVQTPENFIYQEVETPEFTLASWQKWTDSSAIVHLYVEGDGHAFNAQGQPTTDPTPKSDFLRRLAFNDPNPNVVYLARPCQYIKDEDRCFVSDWTTGRFSKAIIDSMGSAVQKIVRNRPVVLIGYSGGAMVSGLMINRLPDLNVKKWITIAGVLNHTAWTNRLRVRPLVDSLEMTSLPTVPQVHFVGEKDRIVPPDLTAQLAPQGTVVIVPNATHNSGFESVQSVIYQ